MQTDMSCFTEVPSQALTATPMVTPLLALCGVDIRATPVYERSRECGLDFLSQDTHDIDMTSHHPDKVIDSLLPHITEQCKNILRVYVNLFPFPEIS